MRLALDVEAQQSFEFLSNQVQGLRKAFSALSDVLVEEVDVIRSEASERHSEIEKQLAAQTKGLKAVCCPVESVPSGWFQRRAASRDGGAQVRTELALLRTDALSGRSALDTKAAALDTRVESMQGDLALLAQARARPSGAAPWLVDRQFLIRPTSTHIRQPLAPP